jgi:hypothetical protein
VSRLFQLWSRLSSTRSSSPTVKGGNAPGKLDVARAANASSGMAASLPPPLSVKSTTMRCSVSTTSPGEWSRSRWGWPVKSVTVTNRSSGWPGEADACPPGPPPSDRRHRAAGR